jgi:hypothetical protein
MKDKVICDKYNDCPLKNGDCYHSTEHYHIDNCFPALDSNCGGCKSIKEIRQYIKEQRKLKLEKINENSNC